MMKLFRKKFLTFLTIVLLLIYELTPSVVFAQRERTKVGFIGFKFHNVSLEDRKAVTNGILYLLAKKPIDLISPEEARTLVGEERINAVLSNPTDREIFLLANMLGVDYLFFGNFVNQTGDTTNPVLVGTLECFERPKRRFHTTEITWRLDNIDREVKEIDKKFVSKILPGSGTIMTTFFFIVVLGIAAVGLYYMISEILIGSGEETAPSPLTQ